ncbi:MAG: tetratricopeptide repeat protein [Candidatus Cloacimonas sp.]
MTNKLRRIILLAVAIIVLLLLLEILLQPKALRQTFADTFYKAKNYKQAEKLLRKNTIKNDATAFSNLGKCLYKQNQYPEADSAISLALEKTKNKKDLLYDRGNTAFQQKEYQKALDDYKEALLLNPNDEDLRANYELTLRKIQKQPTPQPQVTQNKNNQKEEEIRNILKGLDNKESTDRQQQKSNQSSKTDKWW